MDSGKITASEKIPSIEIKTGCLGVFADNLVDLFHSVGWTTRSVKHPSKLLMAVAKSPLCYTAWDNNENKLVGLITALTDDYNYYITYLLVRPEYQNKGIGSALLNHVMSHADATDRVYLGTDDAAEFYKKHGFCKRNMKLMFHGPLQ